MKQIIYVVKRRSSDETGNRAWISHYTESLDDAYFHAALCDLHEPKLDGHTVEIFETIIDLSNAKRIDHI